MPSPERMNRIQRKTAVSIGEVMKEFIRSNHLEKALNTRRVFAAWDAASGAGPYTIKKFYRDGKLYITLSSSVVRSQLHFQRQTITEKFNAILSEDNLFTKEEKTVGYVKEIILK